MRSTFRIALAAMTMLAASGPALSAQSAMSEQRVSFSTATNLPFKVSAASDAARARLDKADELLMEGKFSAAAREYAAVARLQQAEHVIPAEALWKLAEIHHGRKNYLRSAGVLSELATIAERYGDPALQARALLEAAILYQAVGESQRAQSALDRLEPLLHSPSLSKEVRSSLQSRIIS